MTTLFNYQSTRNAWCISGVVSASRAIAIVAILKTMSLYGGKLAPTVPDGTADVIGRHQRGLSDCDDILCHLTPVCRRTSL